MLKRDIRILQINEQSIKTVDHLKNKKGGLLTLYRPPKDLNYGFNDNLKHNLGNMWLDGMTEIIVNRDLNSSEIVWADGYPQITMDSIIK